MPFLRRRELVGGIGLWFGAPLLGAFCRSMTEEALGLPLTRKRLLLSINVLGLGGDAYHYKSIPQSYVPTGNADGTVNLGPGGFAALEPYRNEIIFLKDLHSPFNQTGHNNIWMLTCAQIPGLTKAQFDTASVSKPPQGISIDRLIAKEIGKSDPHMSIHLSGTRSGGSENCQSADGPNQRFPIMYDPVAAYAKLFGAGVPIAGGGSTADTAAYLVRRRSIFDFMRTDIGRLNAQLAAPEQAKMSQFIDSIRAIEQRLSTLAAPGSQPACTKRPAPKSAVDGAKVEGQTPVDPVAAASMVDMAAAALACGLTRVAVVSWEGQKAFPFLGDPYIGIHAMWHGSFPGYPRQPALSVSEMHKRYYAYHTQSVANVRKQLGAIREGDKTIADNTLIAMLNTSGQWHHGGANMGMQYALLLGSCGGYFKTGRYIKYPQMERTLSDAFVSIANAMGVGISRFGDQSAPDRALMSGLPDYPIGAVNKGPLPKLS